MFEGRKDRATDTAPKHHSHPRFPGFVWAKAEVKTQPKSLVLGGRYTITWTFRFASEGLQKQGARVRILIQGFNISTLMWGQDVLNQVRHLPFCIYIYVVIQQFLKYKFYNTNPLNLWKFFSLE